MGAIRRFDHAVDHAPVDLQGVERTLLQQILCRNDSLAAHVAVPGFAGGEEQVVEVQVRSEELRVAARIAAVEVYERGIETNRGDREQLFAVGVRRTHRLECRVDVDHRRSEPGPGRQERQPQRACVQSPLQHPLVVLDRLGDRAGLASGAPVRLERDRVERHETVDDLADLAGGRQQADVGPAV